MNLVDTGPLIALIDKSQGSRYVQCMEVSQRLVGPMLTTWPCFTEAMYLLSELRGWSGQDSDFYVYRINDKDAFEVIP